jgi:ribosomal protein L24
MKIQEVLLTEQAKKGDRVSIKRGTYGGNEGTVVEVQRNKGIRIFRIEVDNAGGAATLLDADDFERI